jgi:hypothetical protein
VKNPLNQVAMALKVVDVILNDSEESGWFDDAAGNAEFFATAAQNAVKNDR